MRIDWSRIPPGWQRFFYLFPYLLFSFGSVALFFCSRGGHERWIELWPRLNSWLLLGLLLITLLLLAKAAGRADWISGWLGFGLLGCALFLPFREGEFWRPYPVHYRGAIFWAILIVTLVLVAARAYRRKWFWGWLVLSPLALAARLPDLGKWLEEVGSDPLPDRFSEWLSGVVYFSGPHLRGWLDLSALVLLAAAIFLLLRVLRLRPEPLFLFSFALLFGYWLFYLPGTYAWQQHGAAAEAWEAVLRYFPSFPRMIGIGSILLPVLALVFVFLFLKQKKWLGRWLLFAGLTLVLFAWLYAPKLTVLPRLASGESDWWLPPILGSRFLAILWLCFREFLSQWIAYPVALLAAVLFLLFLVLCLRRLFLALLEKGLGPGSSHGSKLKV